MTYTQRFPDVDSAVRQAVADELRPGVIRSEAAITPEGFLEFSRAYPKVSAELLPDGSIEIMSPQTRRSSSSESIVSAVVTTWWLHAGRPGEAHGPNIGYALPDGSIRSPDASWTSPERLAELTSGPDEFMALAPDFVVEVLSSSDSLKKARKKMSKTWMANGVRLGWLIAPSRELALVYRTDPTAAASAKTQPEELRGFAGRVLDGEEVVEGLTLQLELLL